MFRLILLLGSICLFTFGLNACAEPACEINNDALSAMPELELVIIRDDDSSFTLTGKLAENDATRAAGFQRVCESTIEASPILFDFKRQLIPQFHMNNVVAPIDIAFIDKQGRIESIHHMKPYVLGSNKKPLYGPNRPIVAALEVHKGFFDKHKVGVGSSIRWRSLAPAP